MTEFLCITLWASFSSATKVHYSSISVSAWPNAYATVHDLPAVLTED